MDESCNKANDFKFSQKEMGHIIAVICVFALLIFTAGYFFGKKKMLEELAEQQNDECFANKMYNSFVALSEDFGSEGELNQNIENGHENNEYDSRFNEEISESVPVVAEDVHIRDIEKQPEKIAFAQLCGFGKKNAAENYQKKLQNRSIEKTYIVERMSRSKNGSMVTWYQVVTEPMVESELLQFVEKIKQYDKLTDVTIVNLKDGV